MKCTRTLLRTLSGAFTSLLLLLSSAHKISAFENPVIGILGNDPELAASGVVTVGYSVMIWNSVIVFSGTLVLGYFVWGSIEWLTSGGDSGKLQTARNRMMHAVIGLLLLVSSYTIIAFIGDLAFGDFFNVLQPEIITPE